MEVSQKRGIEIHALSIFQQIPSIGVKFAEDLIDLGYYTLDCLEDKDGARLVEDYEQLRGYMVNACVEDQFRLAVYYAKTEDDNKN